MVKASTSLSGKARLGPLRIDMKKKLVAALPPPFVVSRGYTPEYPWLGQDRPEPKQATPRGPRRPRLLMQQSCSGLFKTAACVVSVVIGITLLLYAGYTIIRAPAERAARRGPHNGLIPEHAALVKEHPTETAAPVEAVPDVTAAHLVADKVGPHDAAAADGLADDQDASALFHIPHVVRIVDPVLPDGSGDAAPVLINVPAEEVTAADGVAAAAPLLVPKERREGDEGEGALKTTKNLLLVMRIANLVGAQRELAERAQVTEVLQGAYDRLQAAEDAAAAEDARGGVLLGMAQQNGPTLFDLLSVGGGEQQGVQHGQNGGEEQHGQEEPHGQQEQQTGADDDKALQILQWLMQPQPLEQGLVDEQDAQWEVPQDEHDREHTDEVSRVLLPLASQPQEPLPEDQEPSAEVDKSVDPSTTTASTTRGQDEEEAAPTPSAPGAVRWEQLNEDDKQDALLPKLAAQGLDISDAQATDGENATMTMTHSQPDVQDDVKLTRVLPWGQVTDDVPVPLTKPDIEDDVEMARVVPWSETAHHDDHEAAHQQGQGVQQYHHALEAQRVPLMYHVLQQRRTQQEALRQEQRATAYLRLLDLHLQQHQEEAEARRQQHQHQQNMMHLHHYAQQWQQV